MNPTAISKPGCRPCCTCEPTNIAGAMGRKAIASRPRPPILLPLLLVAVLTVDAANNIGRGAPSRPLWFRPAAGSANVTTLAYDYVSNVEVGKVDGRTPPAVRYTARVGGPLLAPHTCSDQADCGRGRTSSPTLSRSQPPLLPHEPLPSLPHPTVAMHRSYVHHGHGMHPRNASTPRRYIATRCQRPCHDPCPNQGAACPANVALRPDPTPGRAHVSPICRCMLSLWAMASSGCMWTAWPSHSKTDETSPTTSASTGQTSPGRACNGIRPSQPCFAYHHHHPL